jgi:serine/threonine protein kinase
LAHRFPSVSKEYGVWHKLRDAGSDAFPFLWPSYENPDLTSQVCGTPGYTSPDLRRPCYSYSVDFWALGVVLHEWLVGNVCIEAHGSLLSN